MMRFELPVLSLLAVLSLLVILPFHLRSRNIPFLFVIAWLLACNTIQGVNAAIWADNALVRAQGWCDFGEWLIENRFFGVRASDVLCGSKVTPILYALRVALPAVALCICRQLEIVSSTLDVSFDPRNKYFTSVFHYVMCLVIPVVYAILRKSLTIDFPWRPENRSLGNFRFRCARSQIRHRTGVWVSSGHLSIGPSFVFNLVYPPHPLYDHHLLRRPFVLQLPPPLLVL